MTCELGPRAIPHELSDDQLAAALVAGATYGRWSERAAVSLLVTHRRWLGRPELRRAVETHKGGDGKLTAWVVWDAVDVAAAAASELRVLELACSLGGVPSGWPLSDLLSSLDPANTARVLDAVSIACTGHALAQSEDLWF